MSEYGFPWCQVRLAVAGAFHTRFMSPAVSKLEAALAATEIKAPRIPVISNVDGQPHSDPETIKQILAKQVCSSCVNREFCEAKGFSNSQQNAYRHERGLLVILFFAFK
jgi:acyl transferase domain-containing protein